MVDVDGGIPSLSSSAPGSPVNTGSIGSAAKLDELRQLLLDATNQILGKLGQLKKEIQSILNSDHMQEKKVFCDALVEVAKKLEGFPYGSKGYQPGKVPDECAYPPPHHLPSIHPPSSHTPPLLEHLDQRSLHISLPTHDTLLSSPFCLPS